MFDAWNGLVSACTVAGVVASYAYDAAGRRMIESYPGSATTNHVYYAPQWQVIDERKNGTSLSNLSQQYVWSLAYVDAMVLRDSFSDGFRTQRLYALQNANFDTTGVVDQRGAITQRVKAVKAGPPIGTKSERRKPGPPTGTGKRVPVRCPRW
jgi:hypothetical protein